MVVFPDEEVTKMNAQLDRISEGIESAIALIHDMKNDLCALCGRYRMAHKGACYGCRWKEM